MPRPHCCRRIACRPACAYFKPRGIPLIELEEVVLHLDELEALRLADLGGEYQEDAATHMNISRPTFARIVESARRKVADALVNGKALKLEGGTVRFAAPGKCRHAKGRAGDCCRCKGHPDKRTIGGIS